MKKLFVNMKNAICRLLTGTGLVVALATGYVSPSLALTVGASYTVVVSQVNSDGSLTSLSSTSATADSNGKIAFSLAGLPDASQAHFVLLQIKDSGGNVVRQGIAPAPGPGETNQVGVNPLSDVQAEALRAVMTGNSTDDPLAAAFGLVFIRSQSLASADITGLGTMMATAILGSDGMEAFLLANGVSQSALDTFKSSIVYNASTGTKDLSDYVAFFKLAVDSGNDDDLAKAGGLMANILIDAGATAGIDPQLLLAAFSAAGNATGLDTAMNSLSSGFQNSVNAAVSGFFTRIASVVLKKEYSTALAALGGSQALIDRFNTAVQSFGTAQQAIDIQYGDYFIDPTAYATQVSKTEQQIQTELDAAFQTAWTDFQTAIVSNSSEITAMRAVVASATGTVPSDPVILSIGTEPDFSGTPVPWPIPQTVAVSWVAGILNTGGSFSYTRDNTLVPANMQNWLDSDDDPSTGGIDGLRHDFTAQMPSSFAALMGLIEDVQIVEQTRFVIWDNGNQPTPAEQEQARLDFAGNLDQLVSLISGTTDGTTAISTAEIKALLKLMLEPSLF